MKRAEAAARSENIGSLQLVWQATVLKHAQVEVPFCQSLAELNRVVCREFSVPLAGRAPILRSSNRTPSVLSQAELNSFSVKHDAVYIYTAPNDCEFRNAWTHPISHQPHYSMMTECGEYPEAGCNAARNT